MWSQELELVYEEWRTLGTDQTPQTKYTQTPQLSKPNLSIRNTKIGTQNPNMYSSSEAGNVAFGNPSEQEETISNTPVGKADICNYIDALGMELDGSSITDRVALMVLSKLKNKIKTL